MNLPFPCGCALIFLGFMSPLLAAQHPPGSSQDSETTIKVRTQQVVLDVIVRDSEGRFVRDLAPEEIEVLEDGRLRPVTNLILIDKSSGTNTFASNASTNISPEYQDRYIVVLDRVSMSAHEWSRALEQLSSFWTSLSPSAQGCVYVYDGGLRILQGFTRDAGKLNRATRQALRTLPRRALPGREEVYEQVSTLFTEQEAVGRRFGDNAPNIVRRSLRDAVSVANRYLSLADSQIRDFFTSLESLVRALRFVQGQKHLVLISRGYPLRLGQDLKELLRDHVTGRFQAFGQDFARDLLLETNKLSVIDHHRELADLAAAANFSQVRIYGVDPAGLQVVPPGGAAEHTSSFFQMLNFPDRKMLRDNRALSEPVDSLVSLALETNGLAFYNRNQLADAFRLLQEHNRVYYLVSYQPLEQRRPGRFYRVEVRVRRPGRYSVQTEKGYLFSGTQADRATSQYALAFPGLYRDLPLEAEVAVVKDASRSAAVASLEIEGEKIPFQRSGEHFRSDLSLACFVLEGKREVFRFSRPCPLRLSADELRFFRSRSFIYYQKIPLPAGAYELRCLLRHEASGRVGSVAQIFRVPELDEIELSDPILSQDLRPVRPGPAGPLRFGDQWIVPEGDRRIRLGEPFFLYLQLYDVSLDERLPPPLDAHLQILDRDDKSLYETSSLGIETSRQEGEGRADLLWGFPAELDLPAGEYRVRIQLRDEHSGRSWERTLDVELVEPASPAL